MIPLGFVCPVAGVSFYQNEVKKLKEGQKVHIVHEPENEHDPNACRVEADGVLVGHLPREISKRVLQRGESSWDGVIEKVLQGETIGLRVKILKKAIKEKVEPVVGFAAPVVDDANKDAVEGFSVGQSVYSKAGRYLGEVIEFVNGTLKVQNSEGAVSIYPRALVRGEK
jgi:hypothetical protein